MITGWIIQPQIDKLAAQKKQLDSLRVDMKVQSFFIKQELKESRHKRICFALKCSGETLKNFGKLLVEAGKSFERIKPI